MLFTRPKFQNGFNHVLAHNSFILLLKFFQNFLAGHFVIFFDSIWESFCSEGSGQTHYSIIKFLVCLMFHFLFLWFLFFFFTFLLISWVVLFAPLFIYLIICFDFVFPDNFFQLFWLFFFVVFKGTYFINCC